MSSVTAGASGNCEASNRAPLHMHPFIAASAGECHGEQNRFPLADRLSRSSSAVAIDFDCVFHGGDPFGKHGITFKVATTAVVAVLRFRSTANRLSEISFHVKVAADDGFLENVDFPSDVVESVTGLVRSRDGALLKQLGGVQGLASHLHTDLNRGLPTTYISEGPQSGKTSVYSDIAVRKSVFGENTYPRKKGKTLLGFLWEACRDTTLIILMLCAALSLGFGIKTDGVREGWYDGVSIAVAILLVIAVTGVSNYRQSKQFQRLSEERNNIQVRLIRGGRRISVPLAGVVVGDLVYLSIGDQVPSDGLLVDSQSLAVDESSFTGESDYFIPEPGEQAFLRAGSTIQDGYGTMLVTGVGLNTEWGCMMALLVDNTDSEETPLQARLTKAAALIGKVGLSVAGLVLVILIVFYFTGHSSTNGDAKFKAGKTSATDVLDALVHIFSIAVTIVVVAVPEGLPLAVTLTLAYSMRKMTRDNALVRRLASCETMGSATAICSDKTGTLTMNRMTVVNSWIAGQDFSSEPEDAKAMAVLPSNLQSLLFQAIAQNSTGSVHAPRKQDAGKGDGLMDMEVSGSPTEKALLSWGLSAGMNFQSARAESSILQVETFNSAKKRAGVAVKTSDKLVVVHWKGAAEIILSMCSKWLDMELLEETNGTACMSERPMSVEKRGELQASIESMASRSLRCVAFAYTTLSTEETVAMAGAGCRWNLPESKLTFLAMVGMKDPCRPEVRGAVAAVKAARVTVRMITGDNLATAKAIAAECGILEAGAGDRSAIDGAVLRSWTEEERKQSLPSVAVIARALPSDKLLLVETLQAMGEVVAVTGDGTNDAPALHRADIGLSMGIQGTEVAKESSDIIILDDNFASLVKVVRWGRSVNFNIQKFLQFQLTVNVTALAVNFVAAVSSGDVPLTMVQLLWVNLIMDTLGALALATEPPAEELMRKPPVGRREALITAAMWRNLGVQAAYQVAILLTLQFRGVDLLRLAGEEDADTINRTVIFNTFVLCQLFNEVNARQPYRINIFHGLHRNRLFVGILAGTAILQVVMVEFLQRFASTVRLGWQQWLVCIALASLSWPIALVAKVVRLPSRKPHNQM